MTAKVRYTLLLLLTCTDTISIIAELDVRVYYYTVHIRAQRERYASLRRVTARGRESVVQLCAVL
jgi:hypothetical protein